jgi:hypothetical protein
MNLKNPLDTLKILAKLKLANIFITAFLILGIVFLQFLPASIAQQAPYVFSLPKVQIGGLVKDTSKISSTEYESKDALSANDLLRFGWENIDIDLASKTTPRPQTGYFKAYYNELKEENFILDFGAAPLRIDKLGSFLKEGKNIVYFSLYVEGKDTKQSIKFSFGYSSKTTEPLIKIAQPKPLSLITKDKNSELELFIDNFVVKTAINVSNHGKLKVYINSVSEANFLTALVDSQPSNTGSYVKANLSILGDKFYNTKDGEANKLIFLPETNDGKILPNSAAEVSVITNFQNTLDIKSPQIKFLNISSENATFDRNDKIKIKVDNFKPLKFDTRNIAKNGEGYMQLFINDVPHKIAFTSLEFSINEIAPNITDEKVRIKIQLVNTDFLPLEPNSEAVAEIFIKKSKDATAREQVEVSNWRLVIIAITLILIVGSVIYVVTRT